MTTEEFPAVDRDPQQPASKSGPSQVRGRTAARPGGPAGSTHGVESRHRRREFPRPPRTTAVVVTILGGVGFILLFGSTVTTDVVLGVLVGILLAVSVSLLARQHVLAIASGSLLYIPASLLAVGVLGLAAARTRLSEPDAVALIGVAIVVGFGITAVWLDTIGGRRLYRAGGLAQLLLIAPFAIVGIAVADHFNAVSTTIQQTSGGIRTAHSVLFEPTGTAEILGGFALVVAVCLFVLRATIGSLPVVQLAAEERRDEIHAALARLKQRLAIGVWIAAAGAVGVAWLALVGALEDVLMILPPVLRGLGLTVARAPALRLAIGMVTLVAVVIWVAVRLLLTVTGLTRGSLVERMMPILAGVAVTAAMYAVGSQLLTAGLSAVPAATRRGIYVVIEAFGIGTVPTLLAVVFGIVGMMTTVLLTVSFLGGLKVVPDRSAGATTLAVGLLVGAVVVGVGETGPWIPATVVAIGIVCWDMGRYGVDVAVELDRSVPSMSVELAHAGGSLAIGALVVPLVVVVATRVVSPANVSPVTALVGLAGAILGVALLGLILRG